MHFCTADLKNHFQFKNRLLRHKILPYTRKTEEGTVIYLAAKINRKQIARMKLKNYYYDKKKKRIILPEDEARKLIGKYKILKIEEFPSYDRTEVEIEEI